MSDELHAYTVWVESTMSNRWVVVAANEEEARQLVGAAAQLPNVDVEEYETLAERADELEEMGALVVEAITDEGGRITQVEHFESDDAIYVKRVTEKT